MIASTLLTLSGDKMATEKIDELISFIYDHEVEFDLFASGIRDFFLKNPKLSKGNLPAIHSVRLRIKNRDHLRDKIIRKINDGKQITFQNVFNEITDIGGVRVLHLYQEQLSLIHEEVIKRVGNNDWALHEPPQAYTWDPESAKYMSGLGLNVKQKDSFYTSVHYVVRPRAGAKISCEIQVRTLFEEIWGEVDHSLNYPVQTTNIACQEQLRVLSKVVGAGSRLVDAVFRTYAASGVSTE